MKTKLFSAMTVILVALAALVVMTGCTSPRQIKLQEGIFLLRQAEYGTKAVAGKNEYRGDTVRSSRGITRDERCADLQRAKTLFGELGLDIRKYMTDSSGFKKLEEVCSATK